MATSIKLISHFDKVKKELELIQRKRTTAAAMHVRTTVLKTLTGGRTGKVYTKPGTKVKYTASAPGEPPARPTGQLAGSVSFEVRKKLNRIIGLVGTTLKKGAMLEFGTSDIAARPWLLPGFKRSIEKVKQIYAQRWF